MRGRILWPAVAAAILGVAYWLQTSGHLARLETAATEARARVLSHERSSDIVIVGIDAESLRELNEWPWPRRHHARLLQQLRAAGATQVFLDIDFSSRTNDVDDGLLARALADWADAPVVLASHFQPLHGAASTLTVTRPLPELAANAVLASVNLEPRADGLVHEMRSSWRIDDETLRSVFDYEHPLPPDTRVPLDFSIALSSFTYLPYIDVIGGTADPAALKGKIVYVGPTAIELRDLLPVPVHRALPGIVVQALATESVRAGLLKTPPQWLLFGYLALWTAAFAWLFDGRGWRHNAAVGVAALALLAAATLYLYAEQRVIVDIVPFVLVTLATFVAATVRSLDRQTWRALAYAVGLKRRDALLKSVVESSTDGIVCLDEVGTVRTANPAAASLFGCPLNELIGANLETFVVELFDERNETVARLAGSMLERRARTSDGRDVPLEIAISRVATDGERLYTAILRDVSERHAQRLALEYQATHDPLTGLPNRTALTRHLDRVLATATPQRRVALLMLDLCRFKEVNDTLGHDVGDDVLREVARRFTVELAESAFVARIGGDEFTLVLEGIDRRETIDELCARLTESLRAPIDARGIAIEVGLSIGIATAPGDARDAKELLRHADVAMYVSKRQGTTHEYYQREADQNTVRRLSMLSELRSAIENGGIGLHYQPQVNLHTGRTDSVEALVRWHHAMHGQIGPAEFVTLAETTDLIRPLTEWTLRRALRDVSEWSRRGLDMRVAVNLSARVLQDLEFPARLKALLGETDVPTKRIELEITESAMLMDPERARRIIHELRTLGLSIAIDDYGTGFSSLGYIRDLRAHALKLDKSFVLDLETREANRVIVESTAQMAHALGLQVVAEGVESEWTKDYLASIGYDLGQGFWFARPMPADDCFEWIRRFNGTDESPRKEPDGLEAA